MTYAMILQDVVIEVLFGQVTEPHWPSDAKGNPVTAVLCDDIVERGMEYNPETGAFTWPAHIESEPEEPITTEPTQLDRIESALSILTADTVTTKSIDTAILEGVNEV